MKNVRLFWWVLFLFAPVTYSLAETAQIQLLTDSETLSPTSTIEFRFPTAMVPKEAVGTVAEQIPIEISPALPGNFTWLSRRSGVFSISSPPPLGTRYVIRARAGLIDSDGKSVGQGWQAELQTPAYMVTWTSV
jgi:alpha-2-macroglobulin